MALFEALLYSRCEWREERTLVRQPCWVVQHRPMPLADGRERAEAGVIGGGHESNPDAVRRRRNPQHAYPLRTPRYCYSLDYRVGYS
jgi:hypothetical protein